MHACDILTHQSKCIAIVMYAANIDVKYSPTLDKIFCCTLPISLPPPHPSLSLLFLFSFLFSSYALPATSHRNISCHLKSHHTTSHLHLAELLRSDIASRDSASHQQLRHVQLDPCGRVLRCVLRCYGREHDLPLRLLSLRRGADPGPGPHPDSRIHRLTPRASMHQYCSCNYCQRYNGGKQCRGEEWWWRWCYVQG